MFEEVKRVINNFYIDLIFGWGGYGYVYKGLFLDGMVVVVKWVDGGFF